jgi:SPOR domain/NMT1-like family
VISSGGLEQVYYAAHVDALHGGLMSGIVLDVVRRDGWLPDLTERLNYICRLYLEEIHIVCKSEFKSIFDLNGRTVNTGPLNSGTEIIARRMFELLDIHPAYDNRPTATALRGLPQGDPEAVVFVAGKPVNALQTLDAGSNLRLLHVPWSIGTASRLADSDFRQTVLQHDDYPNLIPPDGKVPTLGSPVYLMTANAPAKSAKQQHVSAFATMFLQNLAILQKESGLKKWRDTDLLARLPHFHRAPEVAAWFTDAPAKPASQSSRSVPTKTACATRPVNGEMHVQLGAFNSEKAARDEWARLRRKLPDLLGGREPAVTTVANNGTTFWRLRIWGFTDSTAARDFCTQLQPATSHCLMLSN